MLGALDAGKLRHRLTVQEPSRTQDGYGQAVVSFSPRGSRWARFEPLAGRELWQARQVQADATHRVTLRYFAGLAPAWRLVKDDGRVFQVLSVLDTRLVHRVQVCLCKVLPGTAAVVATVGDGTLDFSKADDSQYYWLLLDDWLM